MTQKVRQFIPTAEITDIANGIDNFLRDNPEFTLAHIANIVTKDEGGVICPAVLVIIATADDPIFTTNFTFAPTHPTTLPSQVDLDDLVTQFPCATEDNAGKVRISVNPPTPDGECPTVISENDPRIASTPRQVEKGTTVIGNNTTVTAGVLRRTPGAVLSVFSFIEDDVADLVWSQNGSTAAGTASLRFRRVAAPDTFELRIENRTGQSITVKWVVLEVDQV